MLVAYRNNSGQKNHSVCNQLGAGCVFAEQRKRIRTRSMPQTGKTSNLKHLRPKFKSGFQDASICRGLLLAVIAKMACQGLALKVNHHVSDVDWQPEEHLHEEYKRYCEGGYCPIILYQELKDKRYKIVYKLGHGHSATV